MNLIVGRKPVLEAINSGQEIEVVYILHGQSGGIVDTIRIAAKKKGLRIKEATFERFNALSKNPNSQGVIAVKTSQKYYELDDIMKDLKGKSYPLVLILDSIQDPHNLGAILRTAECAKVDAVLITKHNSAIINETVIKISAGATEYLKICLVNNLVNTIKQLKENKFWIIGSSLVNSKEYAQVDYKIPVALVVGNEEKGIRKLTAQNCDILVRIPMKGYIQSLNVSVAAGIILFEILRQRLN
jgi:23S rRNA (guanosine2251-2'-O)-methyltransferase